MIIEETKKYSGNSHTNGGSIARSFVRKKTDLKISFEFFPPKNDKMNKNLWASIKKLEPLNPDFVSVTYGAGGSTRARTHETVSRIVKDTSLKAAAHLTCIGSDKAEISEIAHEYWGAGVRHIVALRGDPETGVSANYTPQKNGYAYGSDLVAGLKAIHPFDVSVSAYPELHPESNSWGEELDNLKRKIDAGATRAITQFFFSADTFMRFQDRVLDAGIDIPIIPGLMLQPNYNGLKRMASLCHISMPDWYHELFKDLDDDPKTRLLLTASVNAELTAELQERGVKHFHFYTLNKAELAYMVCKVLGVKTASK